MKRQVGLSRFEFAVVLAIFGILAALLLDRLIALEREAATRTLSYRPCQPEAFGGSTELAWRYVGHTDALGRTVGLRLAPMAQAGK